MFFVLLKSGICGFRVSHYTLKTKMCVVFEKAVQRYDIFFN